jgi:hypothetical protein
MDVKSTVQGWIDGTNPNYGFMVDINSDYPEDMEANMYSKEVYAGEEAYRPYLEITYSNSSSDIGYTTTDRLVYYYGDEAVITSYSGLYSSYITIYAPDSVIVYDGLEYPADTVFKSYLYFHDTAPVGKYHIIHRGFELDGGTTWVSSVYFNVIGNRTTLNIIPEADTNSLLGVSNSLSEGLLGKTDTDNSGDFSSGEIGSKFSSMFGIIIACVLLCFVAAIGWKIKGKKGKEDN